MIKEMLKKSLSNIQGKLVIFLVLSLGILCQGCKTNQEVHDEVDAHLFKNNFPPKELCDKNPALWDYGFYRKLNNGKLEFVSICKEEANLYVAMYDKELQALIDELVPKPPQP